MPDDQALAEARRHGGRGTPSPPGSCGRCRRAAAETAGGPRRRAVPSGPRHAPLERLLGQAQHDAGVLAAGEQQRRPLERGGGLAQDEDRLLLEPVEMRGSSRSAGGRCRLHGAARSCRRPRVLGGRAALGRRRRDMQAALLRRLVLPPPAAGAHVLARGHRARAGRAADARVEPVVQRVVGHVVLRRCSARRRPSVHSASGLNLTRPSASGSRNGTDRAVGRLLAAQPGDPGVAPGQQPRPAARACGCRSTPCADRRFGTSRASPWSRDEGATALGRRREHARPLRP